MFSSVLVVEKIVGSTLLRQFGKYALDTGHTGQHSREVMDVGQPENCCWWCEQGTHVPKRAMPVGDLICDRNRTRLLMNAPACAVRLQAAAFNWDLDPQVTDSGSIFNHARPAQRRWSLVLWSQRHQIDLANGSRLDTCKQFVAAVHIPYELVLSICRWRNVRSKIEIRYTELILIF
jgi:hypothetical protein